MIQANRSSVKEARHKLDWPKYLLLGLGLYFVWVLFQGILEIRRAYGRIDEAKLALGREEARRDELEARLASVKTWEYIERVARDDLNMQRPGETVVVMVDKGVFGSSAGEEKPREEKEMPNWQKWWNLVK